MKTLFIYRNNLFRGIILTLLTIFLQSAVLGIAVFLRANGLYADSNEVIITSDVSGNVDDNESQAKAIESAYSYKSISGKKTETKVKMDKDLNIKQAE